MAAGALPPQRNGYNGKSRHSGDRNVTILGLTPVLSALLGVCRFAWSAKSDISKLLKIHQQVARASLVSEGCIMTENGTGWGLEADFRHDPPSWRGETRLGFSEAKHPVKASQMRYYRAGLYFHSNWQCLRRSVENAAGEITMFPQCTWRFSPEAVILLRAFSRFRKAYSSLASIVIFAFMSSIQATPLCSVRNLF